MKSGTEGKYLVTRPHLEMFFRKQNSFPNWKTCFILIAENSFFRISFENMFVFQTKFSLFAIIFCLILQVTIENIEIILGTCKLFISEHYLYEG